MPNENLVCEGINTYMSFMLIAYGQPEIMFTQGNIYILDLSLKYILAEKACILFRTACDEKNE